MTKQDGEDASSHIHFSTEGTINLKSMLYLPSDVTSNLMQGNFNQERKGVLNIYFRKVLISKISHPSPLKEKEEEEDTAEEEEEVVAAVTVP